MSKRFVPVSDPERARCDQDEEGLRKHRNFDTPHAVLAKDLNNPSLGAKDRDAFARPTGDMALDHQQLWRKKNELFEKQKTWGRETVEYSNPEQAREEGNAGPDWTARGNVGWGTKGNFGGKVGDDGKHVLQRGEVKQDLVKNEKGLWVKKKKGPDEEEDKVPADKWKCGKCEELESKRKSFCDKCGAPRPEAKSRTHLIATGADLKAPKKGEDARMEAAKMKGRGTADAAAQALKALQERRGMEQKTKEGIGMMERKELSGLKGKGKGGGGKVMTMNSSSHQVRPAPRQKKHQNSQGVQNNEADAKKVVAKSLGGAVIGNSSSKKEDEVKVEAVLKDDKAKRRGDRREKDEGMDFRADSPSPGRSRSRSPPPAKAQEDGTVEVDFF